MGWVGGDVCECVSGGKGVGWVGGMCVSVGCVWVWDGMGGTCVSVVVRGEGCVCVHE